MLRHRESVDASILDFDKCLWPTITMDPCLGIAWKMTAGMEKHEAKVCFTFSSPKVMEYPVKLFIPLAYLFF